MSLKEVARVTLRIIEQGKYTNGRGESVDFLKDQRAAVAGTVLYTPADAASLLADAPQCPGPSDIRYEVTGETTQKAARRMMQDEGCEEVALLNYASARSAGGGFINGAKAQEEDLCRCSGLYACLMTQPRYYEINRGQDSLFYTDHLIYSPRVPWFRTSSRDFIDRPFLASVITAPAPNAGQILLHGQGDWPEIEASLKSRAALVLAIARRHGHRNLVLGAWGCGVFRNRPEAVARIFHDWLRHEQFAGCFDRVVFAVYDRSDDQATLKAFESEFSGT